MATSVEAHEAVRRDGGVGAIEAIEEDVDVSPGAVGLVAFDGAPTLDAAVAEHQRCAARDRSGNDPRGSPDQRGEGDGGVVRAATFDGVEEPMMCAGQGDSEAVDELPGVR